MDILKKLTNKNLKLNKKRTIGTIIGIILSTAMICAVATMVTSFRKTLIEETIDDNGYYHLILQNVDNKAFDIVKNNKDFKGTKPFYNLGFTKLNISKDPDDFESAEDSDNVYVQVVSSSISNYKEFKYDVYDGRYPENSNEIMLTRMAMDYLDLEIGDTVTWDVGTLKKNTTDVINPNFTDEEINLVDLKSKTYKVVGTTSVLYTLCGYTTGEVSDEMDIYMTLAKPSSYKQSIAEVLGVSSWKDFYEGREDAKYNFSLNTFLLHLEVFSFSEETTTMLLTIAGIVIGIIMIASVFCIRNSFAISTIEKMKMYGMLSSVGATKKQIKKSVIYEGIILGVIGIPIGIVSGLLGDFVLFKVVNVLLKDFINTSQGIIFSPSIIACVIAILLAFLTIFLSSLSSARKASKVSPIENLRSSKEVMVKSSKLKTPKIIEKMFKTGGVLAFKNLKRSKKKYRTTVISLTVSIFVFISLSYFITAGFDMTGDHYKEVDYNVIVYTGNKKLTNDDIKVIKSFKDVKNSFLSYTPVGVSFASDDINNINNKDMLVTECLDEYDECNNSKQFLYINFVILDDDTFKAYAKKIGANYNNVKDKIILYDTYIKNDNGKKIESRIFNYKKSDNIKIRSTDDNKEYNYTVGAIADEPVYGYESIDSPIIVINKNNYQGESSLIHIYLDSEDAEATVKDLENYDKDINYTNIEKEAKAMKSMVLVISIFLYGFIALITLIGVTNIFNTITANMELRSKEFAMLKSIGMTKKEFNRMITLETIFYSSKSLVYGTILGLIGCLLLRKAFNNEIVRTFVPPYGAILISIIFVFTIVYIIMKYSIRKINKQNTIETIRNENV